MSSQGDLRWRPTLSLRAPGHIGARCAKAATFNHWLVLVVEIDSTNLKLPERSRGSDQHHAPASSPGGHRRDKPNLKDCQQTHDADGLLETTPGEVVPIAGLAAPGR